ncbi:MAG: helix-turn-helix domain-containing protein, partial [Ktedonobacterales bacterium]|nr:helix-turn-helix domain-containing protein [Ktedonobacterales bacterium]
MHLYDLGQLLKGRRQELRLHAKEVAAAAEVSPAYISMLEVGLNPKTGRPPRPSLDILTRLARALDLDRDLLFVIAGYAPQSPRTAPQPRLELPDAPRDDGAFLPPERFIGRAKELEWLLARLGAADARVTALTGLGGVGKSALAAEAVRLVCLSGGFPGGVAVVRCQETAEVSEVLRLILARFTQGQSLPEVQTLAELSTLARLFLAKKRALIVLDDVPPHLKVEHIAMALRPTGAILLLTARQTLVSATIPRAANRALDVLPDDEALALFTHVLGYAESSLLEPRDQVAAARIVATLGRHTLALKLAGVYAAEQRRDLTALARELDHPERAFALADGETAQTVALAFAQSTNALPPTTRRLLVVSAPFARHGVGRAAALAIARGLAMGDAEAAVGVLVRRALVEVSVRQDIAEGGDRERLGMHPLLAAFAERLADETGARDRDAAYLALIQYYVATLPPTSAVAPGPDEESIKVL